MTLVDGRDEPAPRRAGILRRLLWFTLILLLNLAVLLGGVVLSVNAGGTAGHPSQRDESKSVQERRQQ